MNLLFVVPYVPNRIRVRPYQFIRTMAKRGHKITLATVCTSGSDLADLEHLRALGVRVLAKRQPALRSLLNSLRVLPSNVPLQSVYSWNPALGTVIEQEVLHENYDAFHVEHLRGSRYGVELQDWMGRQSPALQIPIVWDSVDCISFLFAQAAQASRSLKGRLMTKLELGRTRRYEAALVGRFDRTLVTSSVDRDALLELMQGPKEKPAGAHAKPIRSSTDPSVDLIDVVPNGVDLEMFSYRNGENRAAARILFTGKMSYHANVTSALYLVEEIMPLVWAQRPDSEVWLVGKDPVPALQALATGDAAAVDTNSTTTRKVVVTGSVPDIGSYMQEATIAAAPLVYGAGIQNKVLEAMACGTPVVASPQASAALATTPGQELEVASTPAEFAKAILGLLESAQRRAEMGSAGYLYVKRHHSWDSAAAQLEEIYRSTRQAMQGLRRDR